MGPRIEPIECSYDTNGRVLAYYVAATCPTLIDTGGAQHPEGPIRAALQAHGSDLAAIQAVINTHGHWDHAGGNATVSAASGAGILIHELGAPLLLDHRQHLDGYYTEAARAMEQPALVATLRATFPTIVGPETMPNRLLHEGDRIGLGKGATFQVIHVPGHSDDSIALFRLGRAGASEHRAPARSPVPHAPHVALLRPPEYGGAQGGLRRRRGPRLPERESRRARSARRGAAGGAPGEPGRDHLPRPGPHRDRAPGRHRALAPRARPADRRADQRRADALPPLARDGRGVTTN
jgi:hypothetical protein